MKTSLTNDIARIENDKRIKEMFDVYNKEINAIVVFYVIQIFLWCAIIL